MVNRLRFFICAVAAALVLAAPVAASAVATDAIQVFDSAVVLVPSPACNGDDAIAIARLPAACFQPARTLHPKLTTTFVHPATHWYRFTLPASDTPQTNWLLNVSTYTTAGDVDVVGARGELLQHQPIGSTIPVARRPIFAHEIHVPLVAPHPRNAVVLIHVTTPFEQPTVMELRTAAAQTELDRETMQGEALPLAFLNGFALAMAFFNLMLFVMLRRRLYLLYAAAIFALVFYQVVETGAAWTLLWPNLGLRDDWPPYLAWTVYFGLIVAFTREFLELPRVAPIADRVLLGVFGLLVLESALYVAVPDALLDLHVFDITDPAMTALMLGTMLAAGVVAWRAGISAAPYYVLAFAGSFVGFVVSDAGTYDLYPSTVTTAYVCTSIGAAWESIFLALALGQRVRDVELSAALYERIAYLDPLTGIANRRGFDEAIEREWRRTQRAPGPISLIIFDIDRFKEYNDRFGHPAGDVRLVSVARVIADAARRSGDLAARYGGEEFAMLLPGTPLEVAYALAETVRLAVRERPDVDYRLTISAGCATAFPRSDTLDSASPATLLKEADAALYVAKTTGRDRVCMPEAGIA